MFRSSVGNKNNSVLSANSATNRKTSEANSQNYKPIDTGNDNEEITSTCNNKSSRNLENSQRETDFKETEALTPVVI